MAIRVYKPTTPGRRNASVSDFSDLTRSTPEKSLIRKNSKTGGRNNYGRMTSRHRGGGHKRQYRLIDFRRWDKDGVPATVAQIEYDPNRSARIALLHYADGEKRYIIAPEGIKQGDRIETGANADIKPGNSSIFVGKKEFEIMKKPGRGTNGHIAIGCNNVDRAIYHLSQRGVKFDLDSKNVKNGKTVACYMEGEIAGFAFHLVQA